MNGHRDDEGLARLLDAILTEPAETEDCLPVWRLDAGIREGFSVQDDSHLRSCSLCQRALIIMVREIHARADLVRAWGSQRSGDLTGAALRQHIDEDDCDLCAEALAAVSQTSIPAASHPSGWELVLAAAGLLPPGRHRQVQDHLAGGCALCVHVSAAKTTGRLIDAVRRYRSALDAMRAGVASAVVPLQTVAVYAEIRQVPRSALAVLDQAPVFAVLNGDDDVISLEITVTGDFQRAAAWVATKQQIWEGELKLQPSGAVRFGAAVLGPRAAWALNDDAVSILVWPEGAAE